MRLGWLALAGLVGACSMEKAPSPRGLRVPLPDGWVANAGTAGTLMVGPKGRVVLSLERRTAALPSIASLKSAVEAEGGVVVRASAAEGSATVRYSRSPAAGLLAVRTLDDGALLLCASTPGAGPGELETAEVLCAGVRIEAAGGR